MMKCLEPGNYLKRRDGEKAYCYGQVPGRESVTVVGLIGIPVTYTVDSFTGKQSNASSGMDVIGPWTEPEHRIETVVMYRSTVKPSYVYCELERDSLKPHNAVVIARKRVAITEGEGM